MVTERQGAFSPYDWAAKQGQNVTGGFTRVLAPGWEVIVDGGVRRKQEQAQFFVTTETLRSTSGENAVDTTLTTASFTPRLKINSNLFGLPTKAIGGFDYYNADYNSDRPMILGAAPKHKYDLNQSSAALYWQQTVSILPSTDVSFGGRIQQTKINARDAFNDTRRAQFRWFAFRGLVVLAIRPAFRSTRKKQTAPITSAPSTASIENFALFGRMAQSFRVPNVDDRVGMVTALNGIPTTFDLRTQKSHDLEGGVRIHFGPLDVQWSMYDMRLTDEIHFRFGPNFEVEQYQPRSDTALRS